MCFITALFSVTGFSSANIPQTKPLLTITEGLNQPTAVDVDKAGNIFVLDGVNAQVAVFSPEGKAKFRFGTYGAENTQFNLPMALRIADEKVIVADTGNHRFSMFDLQGKFLRTIRPVQTESDKPLLTPEPVALHIDNNILTWSDRRNHQICQQWLDTEKLIACNGSKGDQARQFMFPFQIAQDRDHYLHIVDVLNGRIQAYNRRGSFAYQISRFGTAKGELYRPNAIAFDESNKLYISDAYFGTISVFDNGQFLGHLNTGASLKTPTDMRWSNGRLLVVDSQLNTVFVFEGLSIAPPNNHSEPPINSKQPSTKLSQKNCINCHLSWDKSLSSFPATTDKMLPVASPNMCFSCHHGAIVDSRTAIGQRHQHSTVHESSYETLILDNRVDRIPSAFPLTDSDELSCVSCHTPHNNEANQQTLYGQHQNAWLRESNNHYTLCEQCHESKGSTQVQVPPSRAAQNHPLAIRLATDTIKGFEKTTIESLKKGLPSQLKQHGASLGNNDELICQSCHQIHGGYDTALLSAPQKESTLCISCHQKEASKNLKDARKKGVHPANFKLDEPLKFLGQQIEKISCETCHQVHNGQPETALLPTGVENAESLCKECHRRQHAKNQDDATNNGIHPVNIALDEPVTITDKKVETIGCLSCHSVHEGQHNTPTLLEPAHNGQLCAHCHEQASLVVNSDHDLRFSAPKSINHLKETPSQSGVCGSCHSLHRAGKESDNLSIVSQLSTLNDKPKLAADRACINCHQNQGIAEKKVVTRYQHPSKDLILRSSPNVMPLLNKHEKIAEFGEVACITCHDPHKWKPKQKKILPEPPLDKSNIEGNSHSSFLRNKGVSNTFCVDCHGIDALVKYRLYHEEKVENSDIDYIE